MNKDILNTGIQEFINKKIDTDTMSVLLKKSPFQGVSSKELVEQIEAKKKCKKKLPKWFSTTQIYYPNKLNIEQTSSEKTAQYKASLLTKKTILDLTGGFGIDSYYFSHKMDQVFHCEINKKLSNIAVYNFKILEAENIISIPENGLEYLEKNNPNFDWIYIDPSRRNDSKGKVFLLSDCLPDVPNNLELLFEKTNNILIKTSPLLDFSIGISELKHVKEIHVIALENEVKELLWVLKKGHNNNIDITTVNITKRNTVLFKFNLEEEKEVTASFSLPLQYLYEPNASILKSGAFKTLSHQLEIPKLQTNTHLYTHNTLLSFPGRVFKITKILAYNKREIKQLQISKANITIRNFPESVASIRKKHKIKDGGDTYLFFTKNMDNNLTVLVCTKT